MSYRIPFTERAEFFCLPLGENPTAYDSYLVRVHDGINNDEQVVGWTGERAAED